MKMLFINKLPCFFFSLVNNKTINPNFLTCISDQSGKALG